MSILGIIAIIPGVVLLVIYAVKRAVLKLRRQK